MVGPRHTDALDLTLLDHGILLMPRNAPHGLTMGHLAQQFGTEASVITYRLKRMEGRGLATCERNRDDHRLVAASITAAGDSMCDAAGPLHVASVRNHFMDHVPRSGPPVIADVFAGVYAAQQQPWYSTVQDASAVPHGSFGQCFDTVRRIRRPSPSAVSIGASPTNPTDS